jgi:TatD DNase family protein
MSAPLRVFDSHCHLQDERFDPDRAEVLARARDAGVEGIVVIGSDPETAATGRALTEEAGERSDWPSLWFTAGLHPHEASRWGSDQLGMAVERGLPVVVHSRDAEEDTLEILRESGIAGPRVVLHCFTGSLGMLAVARERGHYVSLSGISTFASFDTAGIAPQIPENRLLVETDAPYLAPVPYRGKRNEPAFLPATVTALATRRDVPPETLAETTRRNALDFYRLG